MPHPSVAVAFCHIAPGLAADSIAHFHASARPLPLRLQPAARADRAASGASAMQIDRECAARAYHESCALALTHAVGMLTEASPVADTDYSLPHLQVLPPNRRLLQLRQRQPKPCPTLLTSLAPLLLASVSMKEVSTEWPLRH